MAAKIDTLMIACMDYRLNERVNEALGSGRVVVLRNAGGDAESLTKNIEDVLDTHPSINKVLFCLHDSGCGGMVVAWGVNRRHDPALAVYGGRFRRLGPAVEKSEDQKALEERENPAFQVGMLKEKFANGFGGRKISVESEVVHVPEKSQAEHFLLITKSLGSYDRLRADYINLEPEHAYIIHYSKDVKEVMDDINIAVRVLKLSCIKTIAIPDSDFKDIRKEVGNDVRISSLAQSRDKVVN